ncbi:MAG: hypothetical protein NHB15_18425 [Methanosarcina barkeri]|nr:hypothetical protein [Methanosarcina sp. ERenArc_MAG2]
MVIGIYVLFLNMWLLFQGVRIEPDRLREEYRRKVIVRLGSSGQQHPDIRIEEIFAEICAENAFREVNPFWLGIEAARTFRTVSLKKLEAYPQSSHLLEKYRNVPKCSFQCPEGLYGTGTSFSGPV